MKALFIDGEYGSLTPQTGSMLSLGWCVIDLDQGTILRQQEFFVKYGSPQEYKISPKAFEIHGITAEFAFENGTEPHIIRDQLFDSFIGCEISGGHNFRIDQDFIEYYLLNGESFRDHFGYRTLDTYSAALLFLGSRADSGQTITQILKSAKIDMTDIKGKAHSAMWDAIASARIFSYMRQLIKGKS
jgi:DNA polymerase III alpha subunit (gram-positive type)